MAEHMLEGLSQNTAMEGVQAGQLVSLIPSLQLS